MKGGKNNGTKRFVLKGCYGCGALETNQNECVVWRKLLDSNGPPPKDHMGKKDKALAS